MAFPFFQLGGKHGMDQPTRATAGRAVMVCVGARMRSTAAADGHSVVRPLWSPARRLGCVLARHGSQ